MENLGEKGKFVLVIWVMVFDNRLYMCKESEKGEYCYYIRWGIEIKKVFF